MTNWRWEMTESGSVCECVRVCDPKWKLQCGAYPPPPSLLRNVILLSWLSLNSESEVSQRNMWCPHEQRGQLRKSGVSWVAVREGRPQLQFVLYCATGTLRKDVYCWLFSTLEPVQQPKLQNQCSSVKLLHAVLYFHWKSNIDVIQWHSWLTCFLKKC